MGIEGQAFEHDRVVVGNQQRPVIAGRCFALGVVQRKVDPVLIGADKPAPLTLIQSVIDTVIVAFNPGRKAVEGAGRLIGIQHPTFTGGFAVEQQDELALGTGAVAMQEKTPVRLMEHLVRGGFSECVAQQFVGTVCVVQRCEKQRLAVIGPRHAAIARLERQLSHGPAGQLFDEQAVGFFATGVEAVSQPLMIRADTERTQGDKPAVGQRVRVQQHMFGFFVYLLAIVSRARAAEMAGVFFPRLGAGVVQIRAPRRRQGQISLADAALDLFKQRFTSLRLVGQLGFLILVFRFQVVQNLFAVAIL